MNLTNFIIQESKVVTNCVPLEDGKYYNTDVMNKDQILRLI